MHIIKRKNEHYRGANNRASLYDLTVPEKWNKKLIVFSHGYMGYKDWGAWPLMEDFFVEKNFGFLKYNISHNGGTTEHGIDFHDLNAFSENSYSKELLDLELIIELVNSEFPDLAALHLLGHSRGGGIVVLQSNHPKVTKIAALAPISDIGKRFPIGSDLVDWQKDGIRYTTNSRTMQQMPHRYSQYEDFIENRDRLNIRKYAENSQVPICVIHGDADPSVNISEGGAIAEWANTALIRIPHEQHTFGASQPWTENKLPLGLEIVCEHLLTFFER